MSDEKCSQDDRIVNFPGKINMGITFLGELQGWQSSDSTCHSQCSHHMGVEFDVGSRPC